MFDYETLRVVWWLLLGILLTGFAIMDGFDLGVIALLRVLARDDDERRALLETVEPVWAERIERTLGAFRERLEQHGRGVPMMAAAFSTYVAGVQQIVKIGRAHV